MTPTETPRPDAATHETATKPDTIDAFHYGRFHLVQPRGRGHRAGMDAMLLAALVPDDSHGRLADLGAGAGAAGLAVASRIAEIDVTLFERSSYMAGYARKSLELEANAWLRGRVEIVEADVTLTGVPRRAAGLEDECFDQIVMNPPFNAAADRRTPDAEKADAHAMTEGLFESWIRTAGAIAKPGAQLSLIARPASIAEIMAACGKRFGGLEVTPIHPRAGESAIRILVTAIKGSRAGMVLRAPLIMHDGPGHAFAPYVKALNNGEASYRRERPVRGPRR